MVNLANPSSFVENECKAIALQPSPGTHKQITSHQPGQTKTLLWSKPKKT